MSYGWTSPYLLPSGQDNLPEGEFLLPVCTTRERLAKTLNALNSMIVLGNLPDLDHVIDIYRALAHINHPENAPCVSLKGKCLDYATFSKVITWLPNDPYECPGCVPAGYITTPWYIANDVTAATLGAPVGSVVTDALHFPSFSPTNGYPRFRINVEGTGRVEIHLASINGGGFAQVTTDDDILSTTFVDLNKDIIHAPPETENKISITREFTTPGAHNVELIMIPNVGTTFPFVLGGGAVTGITLCGFNAQPVENELMFRQSPEDTCILQQSSDGVAWTDVFDFSLCPAIATGDDITNIQTQTKITNYAAQQQQSKAAQAAYTAAYTGNPSSINPDAPDDNFAGGGTDDEKIALCGAVTAWVKAFAYSKVQQLDVMFAAGAGLLALAAFLTGGLAFGLAIAANVAVSGAALVGGWSYFVARAALTDQTALDKVACCIKTYLEPLAISQANWDASLTACGFGTGTNEAIARDFLAAVLHDNYLTFCDFLGEANQAMTDGVPVECHCIPLELQIAPFADCMGFGDTKGSFTLVSGDTYDLTLDPDPAPGDTVHFRDAHGQKFCYVLVSGTVISSAVRDTAGNCDFSGIGFGATEQNTQVLEVSLYDVVVKTVRIRFYRDPE